MGRAIPFILVKLGIHFEFDSLISKFDFPKSDFGRVSSTGIYHMVGQNESLEKFSCNELNRIVNFPFLLQPSNCQTYFAYPKL